ncbi:MAG: hypothetical protein ABR956_02015 [Terracidiphilus sp.]|jgi:hypothetical protein
MIQPDLPLGLRPINFRTTGGRFWRAIILCAGIALLTGGSAAAQITVNTKTGEVTNSSTGKTVNTVDRRYQQITPTHVPLTKTELDTKTRLELVRLLDAEQGFAMRPLPLGHKGLTLRANGKLEPAGEDYLAMVVSQGLSSKPGDRVVLSDIKIERTRIVFDLNGGPDPKHRLLSHVHLGVGVENPAVQDQGQQPTGSRLTLAFDEHVPELTSAEVKALLAPLISFDVKTPIQAYTDTLPAKLKEAILNHHVLVGMNTDMVLFAKGQPETKTREMDGQMPFEEWIYGKPPKDVEFVRINGNHVIRVEVARMGETPVIFTKDEVEGMMRTDGTLLETAATSRQRTVAEGDSQHSDEDGPGPTPSLRKPGETLPAGSAPPEVNRPVQMPRQHPDAQPGTDTDGQTDSSTATPDATQQAPPKAQQPPATGGSQPN